MRNFHWTIRAVAAVSVASAPLVSSAQAPPSLDRSAAVTSIGPVCPATDPSTGRNFYRPCPADDPEALCPRLVNDELTYPPCRPKHSGDGIPGWLLALVGVGVAAILVKAMVGSERSHRAGELASEQELLRDGPQMATRFAPGTFVVQGFARSNWPVVLDYASQPGTQTCLDIVSGQLTRTVQVDDGGIGQRRVVKLVTPDLGPAYVQPAPASYVVRSVRTEAANGCDPRMEAPAAAVGVYGIGGGPRAVGSVAIEELRFTPPTLRLQQPPGNADYAYFAKSPFDHVREEVLRLELKGDQIALTRVMRSDHENVAANRTQTGRWAGLSERNRPSLGVHRFQVRGWFTADDRSWVGAIAPQLVRVGP